jgi:hypothetical protein
VIVPACSMTIHRHPAGAPAAGSPATQRLNRSVGINSLCLQPLWVEWSLELDRRWRLRRALTRRCQQRPSPKTCEVATIRLAYDRWTPGHEDRVLLSAHNPESNRHDRARALPVSGPIRPVALPSQARLNPDGGGRTLAARTRGTAHAGNSHPVQLDSRRDRAEDRFIAGDGHPPAKRTQKEGADSPGRVDFGHPQSTCVGGGSCVELLGSSKRAVVDANRPPSPSRFQEAMRLHVRD